MISEGGTALRFPDVALQMGSALEHRGPDGHARLTSPHAVIGTARQRVVLPPQADRCRELRRQVPLIADVGADVGAGHERVVGDRIA